MGNGHHVYAIFHISCLVKPRPVDLQEFKMIHVYIALSLSQFVKGREARVLLAPASWSDHWESHCLRSKFPSMVKQNGNLRKSEFNVLDLYFPHWSNSPQTHQFSFLAYSLTPILIKKKYVLFFLFFAYFE